MKPHYRPYERGSHGRPAQGGGGARREAESRGSLREGARGHPLLLGAALGRAPAALTLAPSIVAGRFSPQLLRGSPGRLGGTQLLPGAHVGPQGSQQHRGPHVTPTTEQAHPRRPPRRSAHPALGGPAGAWVSLCLSAPGHTMGSTCAPCLGLWPQRGPGARAQSWAAAATAFRKSGPGFPPPGSSVSGLVRRNVPHARSSPGPAGGRPQSSLHSHSPAGGSVGSREASGDQPSLELGCLSPPPLLPSPGCLLRTLAPGHVLPASLQPRCCSCNANKGGFLGGPRGHEWAATQSPGGGREAPFSPSVVEAGGAGEDSGLCLHREAAQSEPGSHTPSSRPWGRLSGRGSTDLQAPGQGWGWEERLAGKLHHSSRVRAASLRCTHPPPTPHPDRRLEASQTQLLLPQNHPPGLQGRTRSRGPRKVNGTPPACCKSPVPSPSPQPRGRGSQDLTRSHPMGMWPRTSVTQTSSPGPPGSTAHPGQTRAQQKHKQRGAREAGRKDTGVPAGREFQRATVGKGPTVTPGWQGSPASRSLLLPAPPGMCQAVLTPANHP